MPQGMNAQLAEALQHREQEVLEAWLQAQTSAATYRPDLLRQEDLRQQSREFLQAFTTSLRAGAGADISVPEWEPARRTLAALSRTRATQGFSAAETATFIFSLKQPLFALLPGKAGISPQELTERMWGIAELLDKLGLYTMEAFTKSREDIIRRQQQELLELSTPVVELWTGVVAVPLIGTLDSARSQVVTESLLNTVMEKGATVAIIDITGVPTVDTLVAQHLLRAISAARLMGAECIISGIRPAIAQTIIHLGITLSDVVTKATLAGALEWAFHRLGVSVSRTRPAG